MFFLNKVQYHFNFKQSKENLDVKMNVALVEEKCNY